MKNILRSIRFSAIPVAGVTLVACAPFFSDEFDWRTGKGVHAVQADLHQSIGYYDNAVTAISNRHYGLALEYLQAARSQKPDDVRVLTAFGVVYDKLGRFDLSARYYAQAASLDPKSRIIAADVDYSRKLQGILAPNATPMVADAGSNATGGIPPTAVTASSKVVVAPTPSDAHPQTAMDQVAINSKDPVPAKAVIPAITKPIPPAGHPSTAVDAPGAGLNIAGAPTTTVAASIKAAVPAVAAAPIVSDAQPQTATGQAINSRDQAEAKAVTPAITKPLPPAGHSSAIVDASGTGSNIASAPPTTVAAAIKTTAPALVAVPTASDAHSQTATDQVVINSKDPVRAQVATAPTAKPVSPVGHPSAIVDAPKASLNSASGTPPTTAAASIKTAVPVAAQNARAAHEQAALSPVTVNNNAPAHAQVVTAAKPVSPAGHPLAIADTSSAGSSIASGKMPTAMAALIRTLVSMVTGARNVSVVHKATISSVAVNSKVPIRAQVATAAAKPANTNIAGGTTRRTVSASAPVAATAQNTSSAHRQTAIDPVVASKDPVPAMVGASAASKSFFLTGHPLAIVDASGRNGIDKSVRAYLSGRGWSIARGESLKTQTQPQTAIFYKETMATAAKALARTLSLPLPMHLTSRGDVAGLQLVLGSDISGQVVADKFMQVQRRQLALATAKPKS